MSKKDPFSKEDFSNRELWDLLEQTSSDEPSTMFSRNVVREARKLSLKDRDSRDASVFSWLKPAFFALILCGVISGLVAYNFLKSDTGEITRLESELQDPTTEDSQLVYEDEFENLNRFESFLAQDDISTIEDNDLDLLLVGIF